jgi:hypothetical protein
MPRSLKVLFIVGALVVALVPVAAVAGHQFTDVPNNHTFHSDISWLADNGITKGCNPPANTMYCPDGPVTRGQMAAFMHRFYNSLIPNVAFTWVSGSALSGDGVSVDARFNVSRNGYLLVWASADVANTTESDFLWCGINLGDSIDNAKLDSWRPIDLTTDVADTCATQTALFVTPGTQILRLVIDKALATTETGVNGASIMAVLFPDDGTSWPFAREALSVPAPEASDEPKNTD